MPMDKYSCLFLKPIKVLLIIPQIFISAESANTILEQSYVLPPSYLDRSIRRCTIQVILHNSPKNSCARG